MQRSDNEVSKSYARTQLSSNNAGTTQKSRPLDRTGMSNEFDRLGEPLSGKSRDADMREPDSAGRLGERKLNGAGGYLTANSNRSASQPERALKPKRTLGNVGPNTMRRQPTLRDYK